MPPDADSPRRGTNSLNESTEAIASDGTEGVDATSPRHDAANLSVLSEPSGAPENPLRSDMADFSNPSGNSAMPGNPGHLYAAETAVTNERSPGDIDIAGSGEQGNDTGPLGHESDSLAANANSIGGESSNGQDRSESLLGSASGAELIGLSGDSDTGASANDLPAGNIPHEAPRPNVVNPVAPVRELHIEDLAGGLERVQEQQAETMELVALLADRVDAYERSQVEVASLVEKVSELSVSLEETQVVLLDVADRVGNNETANGQDHEDFSRTIAEIDERVKNLMANIAVLSRMTVSAVGAARTEGVPENAAFPGLPQGLPMSEDDTIYIDADEHGELFDDFDDSPPFGSVPSNVAVGDFVEGYGYVIAIDQRDGGEKFVIMELGTVVVTE